MPLKKSELYSSLWQACDELRGGMDASQYKDYVLTLLFIKYISDKYQGDPFGTINVPEGASFNDMVRLKGTNDIGDRINKQIIGPIVEANSQLVIDTDFNDVNKLGDGKEMVDRLTNLIAIFEDARLDFSSNRADGDDLLGDAYEYLMRHFATESGKSKGQFYTPSEVSRIMAKIIGITPENSNRETTVYDPTCGSGSLLLKVADEGNTNGVSLFGQEKDASTAALARMNMILHDYPTASIHQGNTLSNPKFTASDTALKTFDYIVANPPFSDKRWSTGVQADADPFERFHYGEPPSKNGDYAYLLHIIRSLKRTGKGACILPHGVLFRGNAEETIRRNLVRAGVLKGIIGLPANLFYGTGIPACIVVVDKDGADNRDALFMVDASKGFMKDGNKNRLRSQDIHKIVDVFNHEWEIPGYARKVSHEEIEANDYNLNIPRYIDNQEKEDTQDITAHLQGGIPEADIAALNEYWEVYPQLKQSLFGEALRPGYYAISVEPSAIKDHIFSHPEFKAFIERNDAHFAEWAERTAQSLLLLAAGGEHPKKVIFRLSEDLLDHYSDRPLLNRYEVYQHLMDYWATTFQDDVYMIHAEGWKAETRRITEVSKGRTKDRGWTCDLLPKDLVVNRFFAEEAAQINELQAQQDQAEAELSELEEEHSGEEGAFAELDKINKGSVSARLKEMKAEQNQLFAEPDEEAKGEIEVLERWVKLYTQSAKLKKAIKEAEAALDQQAYDKYPELDVADIQSLVIHDKWLATLKAEIGAEVDRVSQQLAGRVKELAERYAHTLGELEAQVTELEQRVQGHLLQLVKTEMV